MVCSGKEKLRGRQPHICSAYILKTIPKKGNVKECSNYRTIAQLNWYTKKIRSTKLDGVSCQLSSVQPLSCVQLSVTPWTVARQASLSITNSQSSLKLTSIESVMPSNHLILCRPLLLLPQSLSASESFPMSQLFAWGGQSTGVSALASFLPKKS